MPDTISQYVMTVQPDDYNYFRTHSEEQKKAMDTHYATANVH